MNSRIGSSEANQSERLLYLLDKAYEAPFQPDNFHDLMKAAHNFYFKSWDDLSVTDIKSADLENDMTLASHLNRIEHLIVEQELENRSHATNLNRPALIALLINPETWICQGNDLAAEFFGQRFPCAFKELKLEKFSLSNLKKLVKRATSSGFNN